MRIRAYGTERLDLVEYPWPMWAFGLLPTTIAIGSFISAMVQWSEAPAPTGSAGSHPSTMGVMGLVGIHLLIAALGVGMLAVPYTQWTFDLASGRITRIRRWLYIFQQRAEWPLESVVDAELVERDSSEGAPTYGVDLKMANGDRVPLSVVDSTGMIEKQMVVDAVRDLLERRR